MVHPALDIDGSTNHAGMKKAASIFLKSRKIITAWFDSIYCYALWYCRRTFCNAPDLDLQCWWKTKKININILIAREGLEPLQMWDSKVQIFRTPTANVLIA